MAHGGPRVQSTAPPSSGTPPAHLYPTQFYTHCPLAFGMCQPLGTACHLYHQGEARDFSPWRACCGTAQCGPQGFSPVGLEQYPGR